MAEKLKTYHLMIIDKSGSMENVRDVTISGLNENLQSIRKAQEDFEDQEQIACMVTFNGGVWEPGEQVDHISCWKKATGEVQDFTRDNYAPLGGTPLLDAVGISISKLREEIKDELLERKATVVVTIFTDGQENTSREYSQQQIKDLITEIKETGQWTVAFAGCGDNVFEVAASMNIGRGSTMAYAAGSIGTQHAFRSMATGRYDKSMKYSAAMAEGEDVVNENLKDDLFQNLDISVGKDEPDSAVDTPEDKEKDNK